MPQSGPTPWWSRSQQQLLNLLFPPHCLLCGVAIPTAGHLCPSCQATLPPPPENLCLRCATLLPHPMEHCGFCMGMPHLMEVTYCAFPYHGVPSDLVRGFKFHDRSQWAALLGNLCWERLESSLRWEAPELVIPIPLHAVRLVWRRYNQSALLAGELARRLDRPLVTNALKRIKLTPPQSRLHQQERRLNVHGVFAAAPDQLAGRAVLLVDDVMTTGATLYAAAEVLKKAGAKRVAALCFARTLEPWHGAEHGVPARRPEMDLTKEPGVNDA